MSANETLLLYFYVFCRFGAALTLMPGLANSRLPMTSRLFFAIAVSLAVTPFVLNTITAEFVAQRLNNIWFVVVAEVIFGTVFGFWCYCFLYASRFAASIISSCVGLAGIPGQPIDDQDPSSHLGTLLSLTATALIFATDLHLLSLESLLQTYQTVPMGSISDINWSLQTTVKLVAESSTLALQMASPFIVLVVVMNFALGLCSKFTPQLPIYFASMGLTILFALVILATVSPTLLRLSVVSYASWLGNASR